jgi:hypothetical protein
MFGMFGPRINTVFRSRWRALWFALSVLAGAYFMVPHAADKPDPDAQKDAEAVASLLRQQPAQPEKHVNPWAKTPN